MCGRDTVCVICWNITVIGCVCICACVENGWGEGGLQRSKCALFMGLGLLVSSSFLCFALNSSMMVRVLGLALPVSLEGRQYRNAYQCGQGFREGWSYADENELTRRSKSPQAHVTLSSPSKACHKTRRSCFCCVASYAVVHSNHTVHISLDAVW